MDIKVDHIAIYVRDLELMRKFYTKWFGAVPNDGYYNPKTGLRTYFLTFGDGARLELMNRPSLADNALSIEHFGYTHLALKVNGAENVNKLTSSLAAAGYEVLSGPRVTGDGYYESCISDPEGNRIEITG